MHLGMIMLLALLSLAFTGDTRQRSVQVTMTAYTRTGHLTASGKAPQVGMLAISRDLERNLHLKFGDRLTLVRYGTFRFEDRMARRWRKRVDVFSPSHHGALQFGKRQAFLLTQAVS